MASTSKAADVETRLAEIAAQPAGSSAQGKLQRDLLQYLDDQGLRLPSVVSAHGQALLKGAHAKALGDDLWNVYEKVFLAALDTHEDRLREECLAILFQKFPKSVRVKRLLALRAESDGKSTEAETIYDEILKDNPTHAFSRKRKAVLQYSGGNRSGAIESLAKYLEIFNSDASGWAQLAEWYAAMEQYELARFCYEELILLQPEHYLYHLHYAELLYSMGGSANVDNARHYFAQSLELKPQNNVRAQYGLLLCLRGKVASEEVGKADSKAVATSASASASASSSAPVNAAALHAQVSAGLLDTYAKAGASAQACVPLVHAFIKHAA